MVQRQAESRPANQDDQVLRGQLEVPLLLLQLPLWSQGALQQTLAVEHWGVLGAVSLSHSRLGHLALLHARYNNICNEEYNFNIVPLRNRVLCLSVHHGCCWREEEGLCSEHGAPPGHHPAPRLLLVLSLHQGRHPRPHHPRLRWPLSRVCQTL